MEVKLEPTVLNNMAEALPCFECLKMPICKHKDFAELVFECTDLKDYLMNGTYLMDLEKKIRLRDSRIEALHHLLNPTRWSIEWRTEQRKSYQDAKKTIHIGKGKDYDTL